ncbi:RidA family protein [Vibrio sp. F74]|uniref:RidA family protein n=1 Tax=Vibrio sp. F74 TaxID=700020 RepID=UPI0035F5D605
MKYIQTDDALKPAGHYSQAIVHNGLVYVSGQLPINAESGEKVTCEIELQTRQVFDNLINILDKAGTNLDQTLKLVVYISDVHNWNKIDAICGHYFKNHKPVRTIVPTRELHFGLGIEVDCIAICR